MRFRFQLTRICLLIAGLLVTISGCSEYFNPTVTWEAGQPSDPICQALMDNHAVIENPSELLYIEYSRIIGTNDWYVARIDWERNWWGSYEVFLWDVNRIAENAEQIPTIIEFEVTGQSVDEIGSLLLPQIDGSVIYVIDTTHQGNRSIYFWRLSPDSGLYPLCQARLSLNLSSNKYDLDWSFRDCNNDGYDDLVLSGTLRIYEDPALQNDDGENHPATSPVCKIYLYHPESRIFLLSQNDSIGVNSWDWEDSGFSN